MKLKYYIFLANKNFLRKKINILNVFLLVVVMTMIIISLSFSKTFSNHINNLKNGNIKHNILLVNDIQSIEQLEKDLQDVDGISFIADYNSYGDDSFRTENNELIILVGIADDFLKVLKGYNLNETTEEKVLICPSKLYFGDKPNEFDEEFSKKISNGENYLNKIINIKSRSYDDKYKIIGIYDVNKYSYGEYNICFTRQSNILEIYNAEMNYAEKQCETLNENCQNMEFFKQAVVFVNDYDTLLKVEEKLNENGYYSHIRISSINTNGIDFMVFIVILISFTILIFTFIILLITNNKFIQYNKKNNLIYNALGYDNSILIKINYLESFILSFISFVISIIICMGFYIYLIHNYAVYLQYQMPICISYTSLILSFALILVTSLLSVYLAIKNNNNSIIGEFSDAEI